MCFQCVSLEIEASSSIRLSVPYLAGRPKPVGPILFSVATANAYCSRRSRGDARSYVRARKSCEAGCTTSWPASRRTKGALSLQISVDGRVNPVLLQPFAARRYQSDSCGWRACSFRPGLHTLRGPLLPHADPIANPRRRRANRSFWRAARLAPPARRTDDTAHIMNQQPDTISLVATAGHFLVFSDSYDPRWSATQAGLPLTHVVANGDPQTAGSSRIRMRATSSVAFKPQSPFRVGNWASALLLGLAALTVVASRRHGFAPRPPPRLELPAGAGRLATYERAQGQLRGSFRTTGATRSRH